MIKFDNVRSSVFSNPFKTSTPQGKKCGVFLWLSVPLLVDNRYILGYNKTIKKKTRNASKDMNKIQNLKQQALMLAQQIGLHCKETKHFKRRGLTAGLDMRCKHCWLVLIRRLQDLAAGVLPSLLAA